MAPATTRQSGFNLNSFIMIAGFTVTILGIVAGGMGAFYSLKGDVGVLGERQANAASSLLIYQTNQLAASAKQAIDIGKIQDLIVLRSDQRYSKADGQRDQDIIREHFKAIEDRLTTVENRGIERDKQLDQLNRTLGDISGALKAVRPVAR